MAHYFESGFFVREAAWHGLGTVLADAPRDTREALRLAGLDWNVELAPVFCAPNLPADANDPDAAGPDGMLHAPDARAMVRSIHQPDGSIQSDVLGIVGDRYTPLQNAEAFRWFDPLVHDSDVVLEAAGSVKGGRNVWILARIADKPQQVGKNPEDIAAPYLLLSNSHDGTRAVTVAFTPIRVVCWNTLSAANRSADSDQAGSRKVRHTASAKSTLAGIRDTINLSLRDFSAKAMLWRELGKVALGPTTANALQQTQTFARRVFAAPAALAKAAKTGEPLPEIRAERHVWELLHNGPGADSAGITALGLYMAATHYCDHVNGHSASTRLASTWFGAGAQVRDRAEQEAMALAGLA